MKFQSCDYSFNCIPNAHKNRARVARLFLPRAGDAIHPALREREGLDSRLYWAMKNCGGDGAQLRSGILNVIRYQVTYMYMCTSVCYTPLFFINSYFHCCPLCRVSMTTVTHPHPVSSQAMCPTRSRLQILVLLQRMRRI